MSNPQFIDAGIKAEVVTITPAHAAELLQSNTHNRPVSRTNFLIVKTALERGEWKFNGEAIKIAADGTILDGQHRLLACVETGTPFKSLIIYGLPHETQATMDTGKSRELKDVLALRGHTKTNALAAAVKAVLRADLFSVKAALKPGSVYPVTNAQGVERVESDPAIKWAATEGGKFIKIGLPGRIAALFIYRFSKIDEEDAAVFFERLLSGAGLAENDPIFQLRETLISSRDNFKGERNAVHIGALVIKAWNKYRAGESCSTLRFRVGGANPERFPEAI